MFSQIGFIKNSAHQFHEFSQNDVIEINEIEILNANNFKF